MKKLTLLLTSCILLVTTAYAQNPLVKQWDKRFGGTANDNITSFEQTNDGGYILGGYSSSGIGGDKTQPSWDTTTNAWDYWIVKTDSTGIKQWDKRFGGTYQDILQSLQQTADGGYILGGYSNSPLSGDVTQANKDSLNYTSDLWVVKLNTTGTKVWDKRIGGTKSDIMYSILQTSDGGYIMGGPSYSDSSGDKTENNRDVSLSSTDFWIVRIDSVGNKLWDKTFGGNMRDILYSVQQTSDGGYIVCGSVNSDSDGDVSQITRGLWDFWFIKIDFQGNKQWDKRFGGSLVDRPNSIMQTLDGGYLAAGISLSDSSGDKSQDRWNPFDINNPDWWIVKTDSLGNKQWDKDFGGTNYDDDFGNIAQTVDGGYLFVGTSYSPISGNKTENNLGVEQGWMVKTNAQGNIQWDKTVFNTGHDESGYAIQTRDSCYVFANMTEASLGGYKTQPTWGDADYWIVKFCDSTLTTSTKHINHTLGFNVYPNPFDKEFNVQSLKFKVGQECAVKVYDVFGKEMYSNTHTTLNFKLLTLNWHKGIYLLEVITGKERIVKKVVKQ